MRPKGLPQSLIDEIDDHFLGLARGEEPQEQCLWYDAASQRCRHYEWRPVICRDYELGGRACLELRARVRNKQARHEAVQAPSEH